MISDGDARLPRLWFVVAAFNVLPLVALITRQAARSEKQLVLLLIMKIVGGKNASSSRIEKKYCLSVDRRADPRSSLHRVGGDVTGS